MPVPQQFVPNIPLQVAKNLRFIDSNGYPTDKQFPNDYISNIGGVVSNNIDVINTVLDTLSTQQGEIDSNQTQINNILASGATAIPDVYAYCFLSSGSGLYPMDTVVDEVTNSLCNYYSAVGTSTQMSLAGLQQCANLNTAQRFAVPSAQMQSITGWVSSISTYSDSANNLWLTVCDLRGGMELIMDQIKPSCSQVEVDYQAVPTVVGGTTPTMLIYFAGYSFIPSGYTDQGSSIVIQDGAGNEVSSSLDIVAAAASSTPVEIELTPGIILPTTNYTVYVNSHVLNSTWNVTCYKTAVKVVTNTSTGCPTITTTPSTNSIAFTLNFNIITNVEYTIDILTSGTVVDTQTVTNPGSSSYSSQFNNLAASTMYNIIVTVQVGSLDPVQCTAYPVSTTS